MKSTKPQNIRQQLEATLLQVDHLIGRLLKDGVQLSKRSHRGKPCKTCKRPLANKLAHQELMGDGDGPDLCWGYCSEFDIEGAI